MIFYPKILLVEDDENKRSQLVSYIETWLLNQGFNGHVATARSFRSGLAAIIQKEADVIILDMTMPTYDVGPTEDGGRPQAYAGRELLRQMDRRGIHASVLVVTQFDRFGEPPRLLTLEQLDAELSEAHPSLYFGSVYYDVVRDGWRSRLAELLAAAVDQDGRSIQ